ncbi:hypothetical protein GE09DRAFT_1058791 [Coniochaeta sp. 2T2.1]|nr:hypothetical protein GE09DRAFT_1058791 [Coniochaeta sp. 2T2.1]
MKLTLLIASLLALLHAAAAWRMTFCTADDSCEGETCQTINGTATTEDCFQTPVKDAKSFYSELEGCTELATFSDTVCDHNSLNIAYDAIAVDKFCMAGTEYVTNSFGFVC